MIKVSIITVVLNGAKTIEQTIQSVLEQTYSEIEYIVIDGGSTDGTLDIIRRYSDGIAHWESAPDRGIYNAMNKGISQCHGEIIGIINSDDWYEHGAVEKMVGAFNQRNDLGVVFGDLYLIKDGNDNELQIRKLSPFSSLWHDMSVNHPTMFVKKEVYDIYGLFDERFMISGDYEIVNRFWSRRVKFGYINSPMAYYRVNGMSATQINQREEENNHIIRNYFEYDIFKEQFLKKVPCDCENLYVWGTGRGGEIISGIFEKCGIGVDAYIENTKDNNKMIYRGRKVIHPADVLPEKTCIIISAYSFEEEIIKQIIDEIGLTRNSIICFSECFNDYERELEIKNGPCAIL